MNAFNIKPAYKIAEYVDRIMVIENGDFINSFNLPLYANGVPTVLFKNVKGKIGTKASEHLTLFGQTVLPDNLTLDESFTLIAYFMKPYSVVSLFRIQASELTDKPIDINLLVPQKSIALQDKLLNCKTVDAMICSIDDFILELMTSSIIVPGHVKYAIEKISTNFSKGSLQSVQKDLNVTERTFQRIFDNNIGISPNTFRRICQFNAAFNDLNLGKYSNLSDIAYNNGYADQSHYIRSFKEFTKITPTEYLNFGET